MGTRPMTAADIEPVSVAILRDDWGDRRSWFDFATTQPRCQPVVAEVDGRVVGTGVGTVNGSVGWVGTIWVDPGHRGGGLGRALTQAVIDGLENARCRTLVLVATQTGKLLYERMGFEVQTEYRIVEAPGLGAAAAPDDEGEPQVRPFQPDDLTTMLMLDADATGEDRGHLLRRLANPETTKVVVRHGVVRGFVIRAPWGGGATVAPAVVDAHALLHARRLAAGPDKTVRAGVLIDNVVGLERLKADGWTDAWGAPRLIRGEPMAWDPSAIWGQFNHAMG